MDRGIYIGWLMERDGQVVGGLGLTLLEWGPSKQDSQSWRARVVNAFTVPTARRQGIARRLLQEAMQEAQRRGIGTLGLATSEMARSLYQEAGFVAYTSEMLKR